MNNRHSGGDSMIAICTLFARCGRNAIAGFDDSLRCRGLGPTAAPIRGGNILALRQSVGRPMVNSALCKCSKVAGNVLPM